MGWVQIEKEDDTSKSSLLLVGITIVLTAIGWLIEWRGVPGALVASSGLVVAITTPIFTSVFSQMADYSSDARQLLFHYRTEKNFGDEMGIVSYSEDGKEKERAARKFVEERIAEYKEHSDAIRRGTQRLVWAQSTVVAVSAIVASFGGYAVSALKCGKIAC